MRPATSASRSTTSTETYYKGVFCDLNADNFPSADVQAVTFPRTLEGVAADGVATVEFARRERQRARLDAGRRTTSSVRRQRCQQGAAAYLETLDAQGNVLSKQALP